jgi:hypothetical protein
VAAIGGLLAHALEDLLSEWAAETYEPPLAGLKADVESATDWLHQAAEQLRQADRSLIDYYAVDLTDLAAHVLLCWLVLQDGRRSGRKRALARVFIADAMPRMRGWFERLRAMDPAPIESRGPLLFELAE